MNGLLFVFAMFTRNTGTHRGITMAGKSMSSEPGVPIFPEIAQTLWIYLSGIMV